jgi:hypothetical protein
MGIADDLPVALAPWETSDLDDYARTIGEMFTEVELYSLDTEDEADDGWVILFDPDRVPAAALPYLVQLVGDSIPPGTSEAAARELIRESPNQYRGTPLSIYRAARRTLTGARLVTIIERDGGDVDALTIVTYTDQTPDEQTVRADLRRVVPYDLNLTYVVADGELWSQVNTNYATWADVQAANATWAAVATAQPTGTTYGG